MKSERYEPKQNIEKTHESCHYCHNTTLQQIGNEKVCAHCGTRVFSITGLKQSKPTSGNIRLLVGTA